MDERLIALQREIARLRELSPGRGSLRYPQSFKSQVADLIDCLPATQICEALKLPTVSLYRWKNGCSPPAKKPEKRAPFIQLDPATFFKKSPIEIAFPSGIIIRLSDLPNDSLAALCKACV